MIYTIKTIIGRENIVMESVAARATEESLNIQSMVHPEEIKGYIFVEGDLRDVERAIQSMVNVRGILRNPVNLNDINKFLQPAKVVIDLNVTDIVEVIGGPFKGERGKVTRYDKIKREITLELVEAAVPIPLTVSVEMVKLLERGKKS
ncbi:MAG TPA: transcription elongation factor Spt5 [archaeon]|nr:transcription elongation factor Spt5 [archaeon]